MAFKALKAAQVVAFFARERGGSIDIIDAVKLAYLSDRESMDKYGLTILDDDFYAMEQGPVGSRTYDLIKGNGSPDDRAEWNKYLSGPSKYKLTQVKKFSDEDLLELSEAETEVLYSVAKRFQNYQPFDLVNWVHRNCTEWKNPGKTSVYLPYEKVFKALGKKNSGELDRRIRELHSLGRELEKMQ